MTVAVGCATARPERPSTAVVAEPSGAERRDGWPDSWGMEFGLRCAATGEDVRFCTCVSKEIQRRWTPEQFSSVGDEGLQEQVRLCRERARDSGAD